MAGVSQQISNVFVRKSVTIAAGATSTLDTIALASFVGRKYLIDVFVVGQNRFAAMEMAVSRKGTDVEDAVSSKIGNPISVAYSFEVSGSDAVLKATNNELVSITTTFLRM